MTLKNWHVVAIIVGCIVSLIISGAIQYHYAQKVDKLIELSNVVFVLDSLQTRRIIELYEAVTPTHDLMMAEAITK